MGCASCATNYNGQPKGCNNNGTCGTDSCNKRTVFDWLSNMKSSTPKNLFDWIEVRYKNGRKQYYKNSNALSLNIGDVVKTEVDSGFDIGMVTLTGELVRTQMRRKSVPENNDNPLKVLKKASQEEIDLWIKYRNKEEKIKALARKFAIELKLKMKISDIEYQGDGSKATFYYTADGRVDFRELIKLYAREFKIRIEMKQVGLRQEASRLGGIGSCGRELCCSTWLTDLRSVSTSAARYQQLSINPIKLAGQCGKLKCCLNFELDSYLEALKEFPKTNIKLKTEKGLAVFQKVDIFKGVMWYAYDGEWAQWYELKKEQVNRIIELNKNGKTPNNLEEFSADFRNNLGFENSISQDSINRFDKLSLKKTKYKKAKKLNR